MGYPEFPNTKEAPELPDLSGLYGDPVTDAIYRESRVQQAMHITNNIRGIEFESFEDWMDHVNKIDARIKQG